MDKLLLKSFSTKELSQIESFLLSIKSFKHKTTTTLVAAELRSILIKQKKPKKLHPKGVD